MKSLSILLVLAWCVHASAGGVSPSSAWVGRHGKVGLLGGGKRQIQSEGLDLKKASSKIASLRGGEGGCLVPSGISGKIFAIDSAILLMWSYSSVFGDVEKWESNVISEQDGAVKDIPSYILGSKDIGHYYAAVALSLVNHQMMLCEEPDNVDRLKRGHFGNALMYGLIVLQNYRTRERRDSVYPFMIVHGIMGIANLVRGVQLHNKW